MRNNHIIDKNRQVFNSLPDVPYLGRIPDYGQRKGKTANKVIRFITVAAAVLSVPLALYTAISMFSSDEVSHVNITACVAQRTYMVNNGVKGRVMLPDSTMVYLNSGSVLEISDDFESQRRVTLNGEGYFDVKADKSSPFYILTPKGVIVKVTGTEFNLCCYQDQGDVKLSLVSGSVEVQHGDDTIYKVTEKEEITIFQGNVLKSATDKTEESVAWTKGKLVFDDTPMTEVIRRLERWYGVEISVEDMRIYNSSFTGEFHSESLAQILELINITSDIKYHINDNKVKLSL